MNDRLRCPARWLRVRVLQQNHKSVLAKGDLMSPLFILNALPIALSTEVIAQDSLAVDFLPTL
jgi:hypothetical protein